MPLDIEPEVLKPFVEEVVAPLLRKEVEPIVAPLREAIEDHEVRLVKNKRRLNRGERRFEKMGTDIALTKGMVSALLMRAGMDPERVVSKNPGTVDTTYVRWSVHLSGADAVKILIAIFGSGGLVTLVLRVSGVI